jgi:hypothetical protein
MTVLMTDPLFSSQKHQKSKPFQGRNMGSIPASATNSRKQNRSEVNCTSAIARGVEIEHGRCAT